MKEIFLFPNAGGTIELFSGLCNELQNDYRCFPYEYPGHGSDASELLDTLDKIVHAAYIFVKQNHSKDALIVLFGYSMGTIVVMKLLEKLEADSDYNVEGIVLAADPPVNSISEDENKTEEENIKAFYMENGGISEKLINSKLFGRMYFPSFKNDYEILKHFDYTTLCENIHRCKAIVFYCEEDTPYRIIRGWKKCFTKDPIFIEYSDGHFFIRSHCIEMAQDIKKNL